MLDIWAMYWKECKELFFQGNKQILIFLLVVVPLGVWLPYQIGRAWVQLPFIFILLLAIGPAFLVFVFVAESFAGEREQHTLALLLAIGLSYQIAFRGRIKEGRF